MSDGFEIGRNRTPDKTAGVFRNFLKIVLPQTAGYDFSSEGAATEKRDFAFGVVEENSACLIYDGELISYGEPHTYDAVYSTLKTWVQYGMPPGSALPLQITFNDAGSESPDMFTDRRGEAIFQWRLPDNKLP